MSRRLHVLLAVIALLLPTLASDPARAEFLDWTDEVWVPGNLGPNTFSGGDLGGAQATVALTDASGSAPVGWPQIAPNISGFDHSFRVRGDYSSTVDVTNPAHQSIQTRIDLVAPVSNLVFALGDIDTGSSSSPYSGWQDVVVVTAFFQGVEVPVAGVALGTAVAIDANGNDYATAQNLTLYGRNGNVANGSTAGNARVTIVGPVDRVVLDYHPGNGSDGVPGRGPSNPNSQVYQIHDLVFDHQADLSLTKTVSDTTPDLGDTITTTITVTNAGPATATGVTVRDVVPAGLTYAAGTIAGGAARDDSAAPVLDWSLAPLASGASAILRFDAVVQGPTGAAGEYRNDAEVTAAAQPDPDSTPGNGTGNGEDDTDGVRIAPPADLSLTKTVSNATPPVGGTVTFTLTVDNAGNSPATNLVVRDVLPAGFSYLPGSMTGGDVRNEAAAPTLDWTVNLLAASGQAVLGFDAVVLAGTGAPAEHDNTAEVLSVDQSDPDSTPGNGTGNGEDDEGLASVVPTLAADLSLAKNVSDPTPSIGDTVTFTVTLSNSGAATATGIGVEDVLPPGFAYVPGTIAGGDTRDDTTEPTLTWTLAALAPGSAADLLFDAVVRAPTGVLDEYRNVAQVTAADQADPDSAPANDDGDQSEDDEAFLVVQPAGIGVSFAPDQQGTALPGSAVFYAHTFSATRAGTVGFQASSVPTPGIPGWAQTVFHDLDCSGSLDPAEPSLQPSDLLPAAAGASVCVILRDSVPAGAPAGAQDLVTVQANFAPASGGPAVVVGVRDLTTVTSGGGAGLVLHKSVDKTTALPGEVVAYTIRYTNQGSGPLSSLVIHDATPSFTTYVGGSAQCSLPLPPGLTGCAAAAPPGGGTGQLQWTFTGGLDPGASGTVLYSITID